MYMLLKAIDWSANGSYSKYSHVIDDNNLANYKAIMQRHTCYWRQ